jgi:serine/threonine protein kinase
LVFSFLVVTERDAMALVLNPFVVRLFYSFRTPDAMFLVMEYMCGGDLGSLLRAFGRFDGSMARMFVHAGVRT